MNLKNLIDQLHSPGEIDRVNAAEDLGTVNNAAATAALVDRLSIEWSRPAIEAIFVSLERIGDESVAAALNALMRSGDDFLVYEAARLLVRRGADAMPALARALDAAEPPQDVKSAA